MKGVIWVRVSSAPQAQGYSPDAQLRELREAAAKRSIEIIKEFKVAESAKTSDTRKQFRSLLSFISEHKPDCLVVHSEDRITRNPDDLHAVHNLIDKGGLNVFLVNQNKIINADSPPVDKFIFMMFGNIAYLDNMQRGERVKMGMNEKASQGIYPSRAPVGYLNVPDPKDPTGRNRAVAIDPKRAPLVKLAFELYAKGGYSLSTLRDELNRKGLRQGPKSKNPNGPMSMYGLQVILGNPFYYGMIRWDKRTFQGTHKPIITADLFNRVQARLKENCSYSKPGAKKFFPFKFFLRCGYCHTGVTAEEKKDKYVYYHCTHSKKKNCGMGKFTQEKIDEMFADELGNLYVDEALADKIKADLKETHAAQESSDKAELKRLQSEYTRKSNHLSVLYDDRLDGTVTKEQYQEKKTAIESEMRAVQADIEKLNRLNGRFRDEGSTIIELLSGFKKTYMAADPEGKAKILGAVVEKAIIRGGDLHVIWKKPFDILFTLGEGVIRRPEWRA